jgi:hypothetical protein
MMIAYKKSGMIYVILATKGVGVKLKKYRGTIDNVPVF